MRIKWFVLIFCFLLLPTSQAQVSISSNFASSRMFTKEELLEDIRVLKNILDEAHPSLYLYNTRNQIKQSFKNLENKVKDGQSELKFYRDALEIIAQINCGHTWLNASTNLSDSLWKNIENFPIDVRIIDNKLIYSGSDSGLPFNKGNEIVKINGISSPELIYSILPYTVGDGYIKTGRIRMAEKRFGYYFGLLYGFSSTYNIKYIDDLQNFCQVHLSARSSKKVMREENSNINLSIIDSTTGNLRIAGFSNWSTENRKFYFQDVLRETFLEIENRKIKNLIIDLRDNRGGSDVYGQELLSYLISDSLMPFKNIFLKTINSQLLHTYSDLSEEFYLGLPEITTKENDTTYVVCKQMWMRLSDSSLPEVETVDTISCEQPFPAKNPSFDGNLYLLINGNTYSTATDVSSILFSNGRATFIGEETGGGYFGNTSGITTTVTLPNTGFKLRLPLVRYETNVKNLLPIGRGVIPYHPFKKTIKNLKFKEDQMLDYTMKLIIHQS